MKKFLLISILFLNGIVFAQQNPSVQFTVVPQWGDSFTPLSGIVHHVSPLNAYGIAVYIFVEEAGGWWTKPYASAPVTTIQPDSTFTTVIVTGGIDQYSTRIIAFLIPMTYHPPIDTGQNLQDTLLNTFPYDVTCRPHGSRIINWLGYDWVVKKSVGSPLLRIGPDNNLFSDQDTMVFTDSENRMHLRIARNDTNWYCSELIRTTSSGYNNYEVEVASRVDLLDPSIVAGLFTWDDCSPFAKPPDSNYREMDIEFSKWRNPENPDNSQFVVQPYKHPGNIDRFNIDLTGINYSDHNFIWSQDTVYFHSVWGSNSHSWTRSGAGVPVPGNENFRINFYLDSVPPTNYEPAELILNSFITGISEIKSEHFNPFIYPNPFQEECFIDLNDVDFQNIDIQIFNIQGILLKKLYSGTNNEKKIFNWDGKDANNREVGPGVYFIRISSNDKTKTLKICKV